MAAGVAAMAMVLSGCGAGDDGGVVPTERVAQGSVNPWDLPLQERPPLFQPCEEVSTELIEAAVGSEMELNNMFHIDQPNELHACGWNNDELSIIVLSTWKSYSDYLADPEFTVRELTSSEFGRTVATMLIKGDDGQNRCFTLAFTENGTVLVNVSLISSLRAFNGELFSEACDVMDSVVRPVVDTFPEGDFR